MKESLGAQSEGSLIDNISNSFRPLDKIEDATTPSLTNSVNEPKGLSSHTTPDLMGDGLSSETDTTNVNKSSGTVMTTYSNELRGFKIDYPQTGWKLIELEKSIILEDESYIGAHASGLSIDVINDIQPTDTLEKLTREKVGMFSDLTANGIKINKITIGSAKIEANQVLQEFHSGPDTYKSLSVVAKEGDTLYVMTYTGELNEFNKKIALIKQMITSFEPLTF